MVNYLLFGCAVSILFVSCESVNAVKSGTAKVTESISNFTLTDLSSAKINVVEVREKDLKEMPLGKDRALAYERKKFFWSLIPLNFKEPDLPKIEEGEFDGSLLPPKPL